MSIELSIYDLKDVKIETFLNRGEHRTCWVDITFVDGAGKELTVTAFGKRGVIASLSHAIKSEFSR